MQWGGEIFYFLLFLLIPAIENVSVAIDGSIDLGPYFQLEYSLSPFKYNSDTTDNARPILWRKQSKRPIKPSFYEEPPKRKKRRRIKYLTDENKTQTLPAQVETITFPIDMDTDKTIGFTFLNIKTPAAYYKETETAIMETPDTERTVSKTPETEITVSETPEIETTVSETPETEATASETPEHETTVSETPETETTVSETPETKTTMSETHETENIVTENTENDIQEIQSTTNEGSTLGPDHTSSELMFTVRDTSNSSRSEWQKNWWTRSTKPRTTKKLDVTKYYVKIGRADSNIYDRENLKVKDIITIKDFSAHILRQTQQVFDSIRNKIDDPKAKRKVDFLARNYKKKFSDFVLETQDQNVRTRLGTQKVILNTIDTSNRILKRLVNYFVGDINKHDAFKNEGIGNIVKSEVKKGVDLEYQHACKKFAICRSSDGFQKFLLDFLTELLRSDDKKLGEANDALTEVLKNTDFTKFVDSNLKDKVDKGILKLETMDSKLIRPTYIMWRNAIGLRNKPINVMEGVDTKLVNKTVAFLDIVDTLEENIKPNEDNVAAWTKIKHHLSQWTVGVIEGSYSVMQEFVKHIMKEINKFDYDTARNINAKLKVVLSDYQRMRYLV